MPRRKSIGVCPQFLMNGAVTGAFSRALNDQAASRGKNGLDDFGTPYPGRGFTLYYDASIGKNMWIPIDRVPNAYLSQQSGVDVNDYLVTTDKELAIGLTVISLPFSGVSGLAFLTGRFALGGRLALTSSGLTFGAAVIDPGLNTGIRTGQEIFETIVTYGAPAPLQGTIQFYNVLTDVALLINDGYPQGKVNNVK